MSERWVLRDEHGYTVSEGDSAHHANRRLYALSRSAYHEMHREITRNDYATTHTAGGYTLTRGEDDC